MIMVVGSCMDCGGIGGGTDYGNGGNKWIVIFVIVGSNCEGDCVNGGGGGNVGDGGCWCAERGVW